MITFRESLADTDELPAGLAGVAADAAVVDAIVETDRMIASLTAAKYRLVAFARETLSREAGGPTHPIAVREFRAEIATALRMSRRAAESLIEESHVLAAYLPATLEALAAGRLTPRHASILTDELAGVPDEERDELERLALAAADEPANVFARTVRRLRESRAPEQAVERHEQAVEQRHVDLQDGRDGMAWLTAYLPGPEAVTIVSRLDAAARSLHREGDPRTISQLRADALVDALLDRSGDAGTAFAGARPTVVLTVPISVVAGHDDAMGELVGYGPVDPATARRITGAAALLRRAMTDPRDDAILNLGRTRYRVTEDLRLFLAIRDGRCRFPGCNASVRATDVDHSIAWAEGGDTDAHRLTNLCRGDHTLRHDSRWRIEAVHPDGTVDWVSPAGLRHRTLPARSAGNQRTAVPVGADPP